MIIEQNVPAIVRNWARCQVKIRCHESMISSLGSGGAVSLSTCGLLHRLGKARYWKEYCEPEIARLKRRCRKYRVLAENIRKHAAVPPENWLLSKMEMLSMIGATLHYRHGGKSVYDTLRSCSEDGGLLFGSRPDDGEKLDALALLSFGFGKASK